MKNLVLIIGDNTYQFDEFNELYDNVIGKNNGEYSSFNEEKKHDIRYKMAYLNAHCNPDFVGYLSETPADDVATAQKIFIDTDEVYLLSILKAGIAVLLASKETTLAQEVDAPENKDNYVIVNSFASELLSRRREELIKHEKTAQTNKKPIQPYFGEQFEIRANNKKDEKPDSNLDIEI